MDCWLKRKIPSPRTHLDACVRKDSAQFFRNFSSSLYKRVAQFDSFCEPELHRSISKLPYAQLVELSRELSRWIQREHSIPIDPHDILIDAPPASCEVQFDLRVRLKSDQFRDLFELSPVVQSLATRQFDEMVKRVRVFVHPRLQASIKKVNIAEMLREICVRIEI